MRHVYPELPEIRKHVKRGATLAEMSRFFDLPISAFSSYVRSRGIRVAQARRSREYLVRRHELRHAGYTQDEVEKMAPVTKQIYGHGNPNGVSVKPPVDLVANAVEWHALLCGKW